MATWVLVVITAAYVVLTGALVWTDRRQLARLSDPVAAARVTSASVGYGPNSAFLELSVTLRVLGASPAVNVSVSGQLKLLGTESTSARESGFQWATIPMLAVEEKRTERETWSTPELGMPGTDDVTLPLFVAVVTEYSDSAGRRYTSLFTASPAYIRTPENPRHSRSLSLDGRHLCLSAPVPYQNQQSEDEAEERDSPPVVSGWVDLGGMAPVSIPTLPRVTKTVLLPRGMFTSPAVAVPPASDCKQRRPAGGVSGIRAPTSCRRIRREERSDDRSAPRRQHDLPPPRVRDLVILPLNPATVFTRGAFAIPPCKRA